MMPMMPMINFNYLKCVRHASLTVFGALVLSACAPKIYVIDNQTILEEGAAGRWPQFEKEVLDKSKAKGPIPLSKVPVNSRKTRLYNVLNGSIGLAPQESVSTKATPAKVN